MSRRLTREAVTAANELLAAAEALAVALAALRAVDDTEARELLGCTLLRLARLLDEG